MSAKEYENANSKVGLTPPEELHLSSEISKFAESWNQVGNELWAQVQPMTEQHLITQTMAWVPLPAFP